jgi:TRAP-type C4-dicarboxylate transport system substrate-binding protein
MKTKGWSKVFVVIMVLAMLVLSLPVIGACTSTESGVFTLTAQTFLPEMDMTNQFGVQPTFDAIEKACKGRVVLERYPEGALVAHEQMILSTGAGAIDLGPEGLGRYGQIPDGLNLVETLPMAYRTGEDAFNIYYKHGMLELFREALAKNFNVYDIGPGASCRWGFSTSFPVHSVSDFKGKKITTAGAIPRDIAAAMGATPTDIPFPEIYMALQLGTIDGVYFTFPELESMKWKEVAKYVVFPPLTNASVYSWLINLDTWNSLPSDIQQTIEKVVKDQFMPSFNAQADAEAKVFSDPGITVMKLSDKDVAFMQDLAMKAWDEKIASKGPLGAKAIKIIKDYYGQK